MQAITSMRPGGYIVRRRAARCFSRPRAIVLLSRSPVSRHPADCSANPNGPRPEVRSANARGRDPDDGIGRLDDFRGLALLETNVARPIQNSSLHDLSPLLRLLNDFVLNHNFRCQHLRRVLAGRAIYLQKAPFF
jgi:hypothetical protein